MFVNALVGFKQADPDLIDVMRVSSAFRLRDDLKSSFSAGASDPLALRISAQEPA